jgi:hypothetical protein
MLLKDGANVAGINAYREQKGTPSIKDAQIRRKSRIILA